jgi:hypothetical protein
VPNLPPSIRTGRNDALKAMRLGTRGEPLTINDAHFATGRVTYGPRGGDPAFLRLPELRPKRQTLPTPLCAASGFSPCLWRPVLSPCCSIPCSQLANQHRVECGYRTPPGVAKGGLSGCAFQRKKMHRSRLAFLSIPFRIPISVIRGPS